MEDRAVRHRGLLTVLLLILVAAGAVVWVIRRPEARSLEIVSPPPPTQARERLLKVYVAGEVANPGVYPLQEGDRVEDALKAAGGFTDQADRARVNLAARLQDQQQINVPRTGSAKPVGVRTETTSPSRAVTTSDKVNLNTAVATELDALPGIGPVTVQKILNHREQIGAFKNVEELKEAKLVTNAQFEQIKDRVTAP